MRAHGRVTQAQLDALRTGITVEGVRYGPIEAILEREQASNVWLIFAIREGKNREVKNVLGHLGLAVARLIRISFGPFQLGELPEGGIEEVKTRHLREQLGEKLAAAAGVDFSVPVIPREIAPPPPSPAPPKSRQPESRQPESRQPAGPAPRATKDAGPRRQSRGDDRKPRRAADGKRRGARHGKRER